MDLDYPLQSRRRPADRLLVVAPTPARLSSPIASRPASPISTISASAGRRRSAPPTESPVRLTRRRTKPRTKEGKDPSEAQSKIALVTGAGTRHRTRGGAGAGERRLHRRARRAAQGTAGRHAKEARGDATAAWLPPTWATRPSPRSSPRSNGVRPARCAVQQCRHRRTGRSRSRI